MLFLDYRLFEQILCWDYKKNSQKSAEILKIFSD